MWEDVRSCNALRARGGEAGREDDITHYCIDLKEGVLNQKEAERVEVGDWRLAIAEPGRWGTISNEGVTIVFLLLNECRWLKNVVP